MTATWYEALAQLLKDADARLPIESSAAHDRPQRMGEEITIRTSSPDCLEIVH